MGRFMSLCPFPFHAPQKTECKQRTERGDCKQFECAAEVKGLRPKQLSATQAQNDKAPNSGKRVVPFLPRAAVIAPQKAANPAHSHTTRSASTSLRVPFTVI